MKKKGLRARGPTSGIVRQGSKRRKTKPEHDLLSHIEVRMHDL